MSWTLHVTQDLKERIRIRELVAGSVIVVFDVLPRTELGEQVRNPPDSEDDMR